MDVRTFVLFVKTFVNINAIATGRLLPIDFRMKFHLPSAGRKRAKTQIERF